MPMCLWRPRTPAIPIRLAALLSSVAVPISAFAQEAAPPSLPTPPRPDTKATTVDEILVTGVRPSPYAPPKTASAMKVDAPLLELPQSIQVVPRELIEDRAVGDLQEATRNVAGVTPAFGFLGVSNACVRVRGFTTEQGSVGCTYYRDGIRVWAQPLPFAAVESIEVVKGPNTVLFGRNEPGGMVNIVTKSPSSTPIARAEIRAGSFNTYGASVDVGGPLNATGSLNARFNAAYAATDTFRRGAFDRIADINLGLGWTPDAATRIVLKIDLSRDTYRPDFGIPALGDRPAPVSVRQSYKQDYIDSRTDAIAAQLVIERRLGSSWKLRASGFFSYQRPEYFNVYGYGLDEKTLKYPVYYAAEQYSWRRTWQGNLDLTGEVTALGVGHQLLLGVDYDDERYDGPVWVSDAAPTLDLFHPALGSAPQLRPTRADFTYPYGAVQRWIGVYAQDRIRLGERLIVNIGGRFDRATGAFSPDPIGDAVTESAFKPRVGFVYLPTHGLSLYAQYQEAFGPNNGRSRTGVAFRGQEASQVEVGAKWQSPDENLLATVALFDLRKRRLLTGDPSTPDPNDRIAVGEVRNRGVEVDISGRIGAHLSVIASYAYSDAVTLKDANGYEGKRFEGVPRHAASLWARYQLDPATALGGGVFAEGERPGDLANSFALPGYARIDLFSQRRFVVGRQRWTAQLNVQNLFDKRYFAGVWTNTRDYILPGSPRSVIGTLRLEF